MKTALELLKDEDFCRLADCFDIPYGALCEHEAELVVKYAREEMREAALAECERPLWETPNMRGMATREECIERIRGLPVEAKP